MIKFKLYLKISVGHLYLAVGLILLVLLTPTIHAESVSEKNSENFWKLWAKPRVCVIPADHRLCKMETELAWLSFEQADICLSSSEKQAAVHCWKNAQGGHLLQNIMTEKPISFWLNREGEEEVLIKTQIRIIRFPKKQVRRRRRHIWSLL